MKKILITTLNIIALPFVILPALLFIAWLKGAYKFFGYRVKEYRKAVNMREPEPEAPKPARAKPQPRRQQKPAEKPKPKKDQDFFLLY